jgi:hypothetical protein
MIRGSKGEWTFDTPRIQGLQQEIQRGCSGGKLDAWVHLELIHNIYGARLLVVKVGRLTHDSRHSHAFPQVVSPN